MSKDIVFKYDLEVAFDKRQAETNSIMSNNPDKIPIMLQLDPNSKLILPKTFKYKFAAPIDQTIAQFQFVLRTRLELKPEESLHLFLKNKSIPPSHFLIGDIYKKYKCDDGYLKMVFCEENTFGFE